MTPPDSAAALPFRVTSLERNEMETAAELRRLDTRATVSEQQIKSTHEVIVELKNETRALNGKLDKVVWTLVGLAVTIAGSAVTVAMTVGGHP